MARLIFITGGARSGKSSYAQHRCEELPGELLYVATSTVGDEEMAERVRLHQQVRGERWSTLEEPLQLSGRIGAAAAGKSAVMLDCLTLWLSNQLFAEDEKSEPVLQQSERLLQSLQELSVPVFVVSNELGSGIVPDNRLARLFRDLAGTVNQRFAAAATEAWLVASGLPLRLK
jgi:adenosylcobinamide kinase/adenosylcobinamide-phosphate guanylyltransferase